MPESVEIPAPVSTVTRSAAAIQPAAALQALQGVIRDRRPCRDCARLDAHGRLGDVPVPRRLLVALLVTCAACGASDEPDREAVVPDTTLAGVPSTQAAPSPTTRSGDDDRTGGHCPAAAAAPRRRGGHRRRRDPRGRSAARQRGARHDDGRSRHRVRHRRDVRHRDCPGAGRTAPRCAAVRDREDHLVHRVERHRRGGRPQRRRHVALPARRPVRPARAQRHPRCSPTADPATAPRRRACSRSDR